MDTENKDQDERRRGTPEPPLPRKLRDDDGGDWTRRDFLRDLERVSRRTDEKPPQEKE